MKDFVKVLVLVSGEIRLVVVVRGCGGVRVGGAELPQQRSGWAGGLLSGGRGRGAVREPGR